MEQAERQRDFQRNQRLEALLGELNSVLGKAEQAMPQLPDALRHPVVLVVGAPRSGTTLMMQWLAASGAFAYPSNLLSRFYGAPYLGARLQDLLTNPAYNYRDELGDPDAHAIHYESNLGKTRGLLEPNEFWYFWRRFIPNTDPEWIDANQEGLIDGAGLRAGIAHIQAAIDRPFATKGIILQYNLEALRRILGRVIFVHTRRDAFFNIQSLLRARMSYYGQLSTWFSVKPREYEWLKERDPVTQVAGQVYFTQRSIDTELASMDERHRLVVDHEEFCRAPKAFYDLLREKLLAWDCEIPATYAGPDRFLVHDAVTVEPETASEIRAAYASLAVQPLPQ